MRIVGVLLAAGAGRRLGGPKALLRLGDETFAARCARLLHRPSVWGVVVVVGHGADRVRLDPGVGDVAWEHNASPDDGMLGSILLGLDAAERAGADAVLVHPVDHPLVAPETVDAVAAALAAGAVIAVPSVGRRRGHPGGFARAAWPALRAADPAQGARAVLAAHPDWVVHVPGDQGCVAGIDTPEDYARLVSP